MPEPLYAVSGIIACLMSMVSYCLQAQESNLTFAPYSDQFLISQPLLLSDHLSKDSNRRAVDDFRMATDGINTLLVWLEGETGAVSKFIGGLLLGPTGLVKEESRFKYSESRHRSRSYLRSSLEVTWTGNHYLMVWREGSLSEGPSRAWGLRISRSGNLLDETAFSLADIFGPTGIERHLNDLTVASDGPGIPCRLATAK